MTNKVFSRLPQLQLHYPFLILASTLLFAALSSLPLVSSAATTPTVSPPTTTATSSYVLLSSALTSPSNGKGPSAAAASFNVTSASLAACPPPMIPNIYSLTILGCNGPCCIPCPVSFAFYEPHKLENVYTITSIIRIVSATSSLFLSICYFILPSRRKHPHLIVLIFAILIVPWDGLGTAWLFMKEELLCVNEFEISHMMNSWYCGLSGKAAFSCLLYVIRSTLYAFFFFFAEQLKRFFVALCNNRHTAPVPVVGHPQSWVPFDHQPPLIDRLPVFVHPRLALEVDGRHVRVALGPYYPYRGQEARYEPWLWVHLLCWSGHGQRLLLPPALYRCLHGHLAALGNHRLHDQGILLFLFAKQRFYAVQLYPQEG